MSRYIYTIELDGEERFIHLVPKQQYLGLPIGTVLYSLDGERVVVGEDTIDMQTVDGYLGYGVLEEELRPIQEKPFNYE